MGEAFAAPSSGDSLRELSRELARLLGRERVDLHDTATIVKNRPIDAAWVDEQVDLLHARGLAADHPLTDRGHTAAERLIDTARQNLGALVADWTSHEDPRLNDAIARIARELAREAPAPALVMTGAAVYGGGSRRVRSFRSLAER